MDFAEIMGRGFKRAVEDRTMDDCVYVNADGEQIKTRVAITRETPEDMIPTHNVAYQKLTTVGQVRVTARIPVDAVPNPLRGETFSSLGINYRVVKLLERDVMRTLLLVEEV